MSSLEDWTMLWPENSLTAWFIKSTGMKKKHVFSISMEQQKDLKGNAWLFNPLLHLAIIVVSWMD